ncbi:MAG: elongation factor Ts [Candidatus Paceibacterota bacterium]|jgi:elongation factor Ts
MLSPFLLWKRKKDDGSNTTEVVSSVPEQASLPIQDKVIKNTKMSEKKEITIDSVKELRDQTGVSIMQCKKALEEAGGDLEKALVILRRKSGELAAKKGDRIFKAGTIQAYIHSNGAVGTILELNCESDFVSNNDEFKTLARDIAMHVTATNPKFLKRDDITEADRKTAKEVFEEEVKGKPEAVKEKILSGKLDAYFGEMVLMDQPFIKNPDITIQGLVDAASQKFGEKMAVTRFKRFKVLEA